MLSMTRRERELIARVGSLVLRGLPEIVRDWEQSWATVTTARPPVDLAEITRTAVQEGVDVALALEHRVADRLVTERIPLEQVVTAVLLWEEALLRRLVRTALEDVFTSAAALNRLLHGLLLFASEGYSTRMRLERDDVRRSLEQTDRLKSELVSMISHDLKTPLTTIQACAMSVLQADEVDAEQRRRFLEMILQNAERLSRLISQIVDLSRIEARAVDLLVEPLDVAALTRRLVDGILPTAPVRLELPPGLPPAMGDRDAVERILVNLIDNAVRFSPTGEPVVVQAFADPLFVELRVVDRGPGVPHTRRDGLFSKFYQVDPSLSGRRTGTGLGLAIVRGLAEAMGGEAGYRPNQSGGSVFWVRIPVAPREAGDRAEPSDAMERTG